MAVDLDKLMDRARAARSGAGRIDLDHLIANARPTSVPRLWWATEGGGAVIDPALVEQLEDYRRRVLPHALHDDDLIDLAIWSRAHSFADAKERWDRDRQHPISDQALRDRLSWEFGEGGQSFVAAWTVPAGTDWAELLRTKPAGDQIVLSLTVPLSVSSKPKPSVTVLGKTIAGKALLTRARRVLGLEGS